MNIIKNNQVIFILFLVTGFSYQFNTEKIVTVISLFIIFLLILFKNFQYTNGEFNFQFINNIGKIKKISISLFSLFVITIITQNVYLNYETITWDVASYLVASIEVSEGYIPMETQWESKGPVLFYIYEYLFDISNSNYVNFRLLNDVVLYLVSLILFFIVYILTGKKILKSFMASVLFILLTSKVSYVSEFSELYCLFFISLAYLFNLTIKKVNLKYFIVGLLISLSSLVNQGSLLFLIPFIVMIIFDNKKNYKKSLIQMSVLLLAFTSFHVLFFSIYFSKDMADLYFANYVTIPLGYTGESLSSIYELRVWARDFYRYDRFLYFSFFTLIFVFILDNVKSVRSSISDINVISIIIGILIYLIGSHNYYHHLFYFLFFLPLLFTKISDRRYEMLIFSFIFLSTISIFINSIQPAYNNLKSLDTTLGNYPLYQLSEEIDSYFEDDYSVFALDYLMILSYLDIKNYSYIVHPMNHFEEFITSVLINIGRTSEDNVNFLIDSEPDVIICNTTMIINDEILRIDKSNNYNCEIHEYKGNYFRLDTDKYRENENLFYYKDPYKTINVYIKKK